MDRQLLCVKKQRSCTKLADTIQPCTEEDYQKFNPQDRQAGPIFDKLKKAGAFFCLDSELLKTQALRGGVPSGDDTVFDTMAVPYHTRESALGGTKDNIREDCVREPEALQLYLDYMTKLTWYNYSVSKHGKFVKNERIMPYLSVIKYNTKLIKAHGEQLQFTLVTSWMRQISINWAKQTRQSLLDLTRDN